MQLDEALAKCSRLALLTTCGKSTNCVTHHVTVGDDDSTRHHSFPHPQRSALSSKSRIMKILIHPPCKSDRIFKNFRLINSSDLGPNNEPFKQKLYRWRIAFTSVECLGHRVGGF